MDMCYANPKLKELNLSSNHLSGKIPTGLGQCIQLQVITLAYNDLTGSIPSGIGNLVELQRLSLHKNSFTGEIPQLLFNISSLRFLNLAVNNLEGEIPSNLSQCRELRVISLSFNQFTGGIPQAIGREIPQLVFNISSLRFLSLDANNLEGGIPREIGNLSNLNILQLSSNGISGPIPAEIFNVSSLQVIDFSDNSLSGSLPKDICKHLPNLQGLSLSKNHLSGQLPTTLSLCGELLFLSLSFNKFRGSIPKEIGNLSKLEEIYLGTNSLIENEFSGNNSNGYFNMSKLTVLVLSTNSFTGNVPKDLGNLTKLEVLDLAGNQLTDEHVASEVLFPNSLGNLPLLLKVLQHQPAIQRNHSHRNCCFGDLPALQELFLDSNVLAFNIPTSLWSLRDMLNNLSGTIPKSLEALIYLKYLNVSLNKLQGEIPNGGPFINFTAESFMFNEALCGAPHFQVMACDKKQPHSSWKTKSFILKYILLPVGSTVTLVVFIVLWIRRRDNMEIPTPIDSWLPGTHEKISHQQLLYATNDFGEDNLIGKGSQGMGFATGNLVRIITCCSNLDFKALVLEYMPNGSLEKWLYSHNYFLDLIQRLNIMIDVASALEYLHHDCSSLVVHCDLKPSNVLLDDDMVAHVADFGIAKLLTKTESMQQTKTLGTIGYMAPVFSRKKPMDEMFIGDLTLKTWVKSLSNSVIQVVDANLLRREDEDLATKLSCLSSIMALALACTTDSPEERLNMKDAVVELKKSRMKLLM
ncbi:putative LRR receptor-like serine/threonine-protein kinase [Vitis vinifera]|uniref:non-specific serine/threonine protein kinase n=1 Tax=Vitis vinifera TaxID=29760 RepID=A0A438FEX4_VITVI|nr:putative LRR receptor-like serine/threonine-protein kinase [Vitis vinifera]